MNEVLIGILRGKISMKLEFYNNLFLLKYQVG